MGCFRSSDRIPVTEVWMIDPNLERLKITAGLAARMAERHGKPFTVHHTDNLAEAVAGAKYVVARLRVGGIQARIADEKLGLRHNVIGQETTGSRRVVCALRTIPRILDIAKAMEQSAPDGYLINFTNPSGIVTEALVKHSWNHELWALQYPGGHHHGSGETDGLQMEEVELDYVGLNHLSWVRGFKVGGTISTKEVLDKFIETADKEWDDPAICESMRAAMRSAGMFMNEYCSISTRRKRRWRRSRKKEKTRGEEVGRD